MNTIRNHERLLGNVLNALHKVSMKYGVPISVIDPVVGSRSDGRQVQYRKGIIMADGERSFKTTNPSLFSDELNTRPFNRKEVKNIFEPNRFSNKGKESSKTVLKGSSKKASHTIPFRLSRFHLDLESKSFGAILAVKGQKPLIKHGLHLVKCVVGKVTPNWVRLVVLLLKEGSILYRNQGAPGYVKYFKASSILIQQVLSGHHIRDLSPIGPRVSRDKRGLPRLIPAVYRKRMAEGDMKLIRLILTLFSFFRAAVYSANPKLSTITASRTVSLAFEGLLYKSLPRVLSLLVRNKGYSLKEQILSFGLSSSPFSRTKLGEFATHPVAMLRSLIGICKDPVIFPALSRIIDTPLSSELKSFWTYSVDYIGKLYGYGLKGITHPRIGTVPKILGKIGLKQEAAGKVRVFAMVDAVTQWALKPLHSWIFSVLRRLPMDGTFDQFKPVKAYPINRAVYSFDLTAATDRLPITLQKRILAYLFGSTYSEDWATVLVKRQYRVRYIDIKSKQLVSDNLTYNVGQPMGALSSWGMLALTHHVLVQLSALRAGHRLLFKDYALLGDDIVIWNKPVALQYLKVMEGIGLDVNLTKSILSPKGLGLEFAKKTFLFKDNTTFDVSPLPLKEYSAALESSASFVSFVRKYDLNLSTVKTLLGIGYRSSNSKRMRLFHLAYMTPTNAHDFNMILRNIVSRREYSESQFGILHAFTHTFVSMAEALLRNAERESYKIDVFHRGFLIPGIITTDHRFSQIAKQYSLSMFVPRSLFELALSEFLLWLDKSVRLRVLWRYFDRYDYIIRDLRVMCAELRALPKISFDPSIDMRNEYEMYLLDSIDKYVNTLSYWSEIFFAHDLEVSTLQAKTILAPQHEASVSLIPKEEKRLARLWTRWNKSLPEMEDQQVLSSSVLSPIVFLVKLLFTKTGRSIGKGVLRRIVSRPLFLSGGSFGLRTLMTFLGLETFYSFALISFLFYTFIFSIFVFNWIFGNDTSRFIPFLLAPLEFPRDLISAYWLLPPIETNLWSYIYSMCGVITAHHIYNHLDSIIPMITEYPVFDTAAWIKLPIYEGCLSISLIIKFIAWPYLELAFSPFLYVLHWSQSFVAQFLPTFTYSGPKFQAFFEIKETIVALYHSFVIDFNYLMSGLNPWNSVVTWTEVYPHPDFCSHSGESTETLTPTDKGKSASQLSVGMTEADLDKYFPESSTAAWVDSEEGCDGCDTYSYPTVQPDSIPARVSNIIRHHPALIALLGCSFLYWGVKAGVMYMTSAPPSIFG